MNEYVLDLRSREKLKELRKEGTLSQEFHRLGVPARSLLPRAAKVVAVTFVFLGVLLILAH